MLIEIEEDKKDQKLSAVDYDSLMSEKQKARGKYYAEQWLLRKGEIGEYVREWEALDKLYQCIRELPVGTDDCAPRSFIPLITPCIEGQVAAMTEANTEFRHITENPGHEVYMRMFDAASEYYRDKSMYRQHFKDFARYYDLLGNQFIKVEWDDSKKSKDAHDGLPRISVPPVYTVYVDGRIKDSKDLQSAEYIIQEFKFMSIAWARKEYGDEYADAITAGVTEYVGDDADQSIDDIKTFTLLEVWTRSNKQGNLQLIEMDTNGLILRESDPSKPFYEYVDNEYPFRMARMIPRMGSLYGIGDGALLREMQETVNKLVDEFEIACRFSAQARTYVDKGAQLDPDEMTSDPSMPVLCNDPQGNILTVPGAGLNPVVQSMIEFLLREAQKATRFHESMSGTQMNVSATATQINTQQAQGYVGIKDKKTDISEVMAWADMYALRLCLEFWDRGFWAKVSDGNSIFIDMPQLREAPVVIPATGEAIQEDMEIARQSGVKNIEPMKYMEAKDDDGKPLKTRADFMTKVIIGEAMPKGRTDMYNILLGLAQMQVIGADGMPKPLISADRLKDMFEDVLGFKLETEEEQMNGQSTLMMNALGLNAINPIGNNNTVQTPTNLQQTVPQMPQGDSRRVQI